MNKWSVVTVIVTLAGFFIAIVSPVVKLTTTLARINTTVDALEKDVEALARRDKQGYDQIWESNKEQDKQIADLKLRLALMERTRK